MNPVQSFTLGALLIRLRSQCRLTQDEVANAVGVRQNTYACWESDKTDVKYAYLPRLAKAFGVSVCDLLPADNTPVSTTDRRKSPSVLDSRDELISLQRYRIQQLEAEIIGLKRLLGGRHE